MMRALSLSLGVPLTMLAVPATAQDGAPCWDRPGNATPTCVLDRGALAVETSVVDWTRDRAGGTRSDTLVVADTLLRYGVGRATEVRLGVTPYVRSRTVAPGGAASVDGGVGDVGLSVRHRFVNGGDRGISIAALPFVSLPVGGVASAGVVTGGLTMAVDVPLSGGWSLNVTPTAATAADGAGHGVHLAYASVVAIGHALTDRLSAGGELFVQHDRDPSGGTTQATVDVTLAWQPAARWQFDVSSYVGLNHATPDVQLIGGIARRF